MSARYKRNFVVATILHVVILGGVILCEYVVPSFGHAPVPPYIEADFLGEMPKGDGYGRGNYRPPEPAGANTVAGPSEAMSAADETHATLPKSDDVLIPKK